MANFSRLTGLLVKSGKNAPDGTHGAAVVQATVHPDADDHRAYGWGPIGDVTATDSAVVALHPAWEGVSLSDPATLTVIATVPLDGVPLDAAVTRDHAFVAVSREDDDVIAVVDTATGEVTATYLIDAGMTALAASPDGKRAYVGNAVGQRVGLTVVDVTADRTTTIDVGAAPGANIDAIRVDPDGNTLYLGVTDDRGSQLVVVDAGTARVRRVIGVGAPLRDVAYAGGAVCVLTSDRTVGGVLHVVDLATSRVTDRVVVGGAPTRVAVSSDETRAYVVDYDRVCVVDTLTLEVVDALTIGGRPSAVAVDGGRLYVAGYDGSLTTFTVGSAIESVYAQFLTAAPLIYRTPRALQPVAV